MISNKLQASLEQVRAELERMKHGDAGARQHIERLLQEIESAGSGADDHPGLRARLGETIRRFEVEHPAVTAYLGELAAALG
jgi:hypothetical protein